ncbi:hypothetical protein F441_13781 [Phytophthora nicotianae CJ01A1]|uniref:RxLR effector protein n=2 Tax=Phytophthora nicotianae TaxID=4792 RepID=W2GD75_PHYNI|nr:hypothetical protein L915_13495 [Phytophthora nicotianae]ETL34352.1 hypothetical protein L916_13391 [Phytophthora nicotianae]ETP10608.1 hypothetical protein F441_13781 [Phytophthora nicotianae CJ01A1]
MRALYILLVLVASSLVNIAIATGLDSGTPSVNAVQSNNYENRFLKDGGAAEGRTSEKNEERASLSIGNHLLDNAATKQLLNFFAENKVPVDQVSKYILNIPSKIEYKALNQHPNWNALVKYQRMTWEKAKGERPYAYFGSGAQTKEKTKEMILSWIVAGNSVEDVGKYLGVWNLPHAEQIVHQNWRAFKKYEKWFKEYQDGMKKLKYAKFGTGYQTEDKTKEVLTKWAMAGTPIADVQKTLGLSGLSEAQILSHENSAAFLKYLVYYLQLAPIRAQFAANVKYAHV